MSENIIGLNNSEEGNTIREAYLPDWIKEKRTVASFIGPFLYGSGFNPQTKDIQGITAVHMDHIVSIVPITGTEKVNGTTQHIIYGSHIFHGTMNTSIAYSPEEVLRLIDGWQPS